MAIPSTLRGQRGLYRLSDGPPRRGGQAEVYRATAPDGQDVAIKLALPDEEAQRGLRLEREALRAIAERQPGSERWLVALLDEGEAPDGRPFFVLPWYDQSLRTWQRARRPPLRRRLEALALAAEAVIQLHRSAANLAGVVLHRDLKPDNILVRDDADGLRVVLADLGGAKERTLHQATRNTGIHTPGFAPLEQMLPLERPADPSVDVHALAVVLYSVLVGRPPQVILSRTGLLTPAAEELVQLHLAGGGASEADRARYQALRRAPIDHLIELEHAVALPEDDVHRLLAALQQELGGAPAEAEARAQALAALLVPPIRHALEADPARRLTRVEVLLGALQSALEQVPRVSARPDPAVPARAHAPPVPPAPAKVPAPVAQVALTASAVHGEVAPDRAATSRSWPVLASLGGVGLLALGCAGAIAALVFGGDRPWSSEPAALPAAEAAALHAAAEVSGSPGEARKAEVDPAPPGEPAPDRPVAENTLPPARTGSNAPAAGAGRRADASVPAVAAPPPSEGGEADEADQLSAAEPTPPAPAQPAEPPTVGVSMDPRRGSSPYVWINGELKAQARPWRGPLRPGTTRVAISATQDGLRADFSVTVSAIDADHWRLQIDGGAAPGATRDVAVRGGAPDAPPYIYWCPDESVRFGCD